jgi:hypothetical protein
MTLLRKYEKKLWPIVEGEYEDRLEGWQSINHKILKAVRPVSYPLKRIIEAWNVTRKYGPTVEKQARVATWRQLLHQLLLYAKYGLPPTSYYKFRLFHRSHHRKSQFYVHHKQMDVLLKGLNIVCNAEYEFLLLRDKVNFFKHCRRHDIYTPSILLVFQERNEVSHDISQKESLPQKSLFSKPVTGEQGHGAQCWSYVENEDKYKDGEGRLFTEAELKTTLRYHSRKQRIILQTQIQNNPKLKSLTGEPLCAARMVTGRQPEGQARHLISSLRLSANGGVTSNFAAGGIGAPIDASTGRLGMGYYKKEIGEVERHPSTGERIVDFQLPDWQEAVRLVERAHGTLSELHFVGWDVVFTESGPSILEGNTGFGAEVLQIPHRQPLGLTDFSDYYSVCLEYYG